MNGGSIDWLALLWTVENIVSVLAATYVGARAYRSWRDARLARPEDPAECMVIWRNMVLGLGLAAMVWLNLGVGVVVLAFPMESDARYFLTRLGLIAANSILLYVVIELLRSVRFFEKRRKR